MGEIPILQQDLSPLIWVHRLGVIERASLQTSRAGFPFILNMGLGKIWVFFQSLRSAGSAQGHWPQKFILAEWVLAIPFWHDPTLWSKFVYAFHLCLWPIFGEVRIAGKGLLAHRPIMIRLLFILLVIFEKLVPCDMFFDSATIVDNDVTISACTIAGILDTAIDNFQIRRISGLYSESHVGRPINFRGIVERVYHRLELVPQAAWVVSNVVVPPCAVWLVERTLGFHSLIQ
jgi:hypothetical protein